MDLRQFRYFIHAARRQADRGGAASLGPLAAHSGGSRSVEGDAADRGACAERTRIACGAALDRAPVVQQACACVSEILSESEPQPDRRLDIERTRPTPAWRTQP